MADVQLALCRVLLPRLWRPISVLLHVLRSTDDRGRRLSTRELPLLFPMNAIEENESASGCALAQRWGWGRQGGVLRERGGSFHVSFSSACEYKWRRGGNHCHSSRCSTKPPDCILDPDMPFFSPTGKPNVLAQRD